MIDISLILAVLVCIILIFVVEKKNPDKKLSGIMQILFLTVIVWCIGLLLQRFLIVINSTLNPIYCDYITYIGICFMPPLAVIMSLIYDNIKLRLKHFMIFIIPIVALIILWTNDLHNLFYKVYSINFNEAVYGPMFNINTTYSYLMMGLFIFIMCRSSIKKSGFFSVQTLLIVLGSAVPLIINILGTLRILQISIYVTPVTIVITLICYAIAILKYKVLNITPIALRTVINTMSDAFVVISNDGTIVDKNKTFETLVDSIVDKTIKDNLFKTIEKNNLLNISNLKEIIKETRRENKIISKEFNLKVKDINNYFDVDIHPIKANKGSEYVGTLLLFKDITQHKLDIKTIEEKQEVIVKQGQLVSIGELAGGVAHDINTPISAIKAGIQMLQEMYVPRDDTEKELLFRMSNCTEKIIKIVNSMRNQIRNLGSNEKNNFKISEIINDIRVIAYNEIQKNKCELIVNIQDDVSVYGDPTKLSQVFTNLIINAIQAYNGNGGKIEIDVSNAPNNMCMIKIRDCAGGIPEQISEFVFKNILTTKGTNGTGLGLYLAYSVIKGEFSGDITFESITGKGTTFYITLNRAN